MFSINCQSKFRENNLVADKKMFFSLYHLRNIEKRITNQKVVPFLTKEFISIKYNNSEKTNIYRYLLINKSKKGIKEELKSKSLK